MFTPHVNSQRTVEGMEPLGRGAHSHAHRGTHAGRFPGCAGPRAIPSVRSWENTLRVNPSYQLRVTQNPGKRGALEPHSGPPPSPVCSRTP